MGRLITPYRAGVTTDGLKHNKYRSKCFGRGACSRRAGGCDIHAAFDSPTGLIYPAMDTGHLTLRTNATVYEVTVDQEHGQGQRRIVHRQRKRQDLSGEGEDGGAGRIDAGIGAAAAVVEIAPVSERARAIRAVMWATISASTSWGRA